MAPADADQPAMADDRSVGAASTATSKKSLGDESVNTGGSQRHASYNVLNLIVHAGRNLLVMDTKLIGKGSSDPQCKLAVGGERHMTTCKKQCLDPEWHETFQFVLMDGPAGLELDVEVEDWDLLSSNDFMGRVTVALDDLGPSPTRAWHALGGKDAAPDNRPRGDRDDLGERLLHSAL